MQNATVLPPEDGVVVLRVAQDGSGQFRSVQAAVDSLPFPNHQRVVISVAPGVYRQPVYVPKQKNRITLQGEDAHKTILTWANTATRIQHDQSPQVIGAGTFACGTVIVEGEDFIAQNITFENSAPQGSGQAVALRVTADRCAFYQCRFLGWQDTAYLHFGRQYFRDCYVEGSVDFIFGNAQVLLEHCHIHCKAAGFITAQSCRSPEEATGYVFLRCVITGTGQPKPYMHLGRPWQPCARVVFAFTFMDACIVPAGWHNWNDRDKERTACFCEFHCSGPGSAVAARVPWMRKLSDAEAERFLSLDFIDPQRTWISRHPKKAPFVPVPLSA